MSAFDWVADIADALRSLCPAWQHIECTEAAVSITRGDRVKALEPGIVWYWRFWTSIYTSPRNRQVKTSRPIPLITKDSITVAVRPVVRYTLADAVLALVDTHDVDDAVVDETAAVVRWHVTQHTLGELQQDTEKTNTVLTQRLRAVLSRYGVYVERAQLTDCAEAVVVFHEGLGLRLNGGDAEEMVE